MKRNFSLYSTLFTILLVLLSCVVLAQSSVKIGLARYNGGGDWYANPTALPNLIRFCNGNMGTTIEEEPVTISVGDPSIFNFPYVHLTGHGNVLFSEEEAENLRDYMMGGGFLHIDDNYGLEEFIIPEMRKVFPELTFIELPYDFPLFHQQYSFPKGLPKIHEHDNKPAQAFGLFWEDRLVCLFTYECDLGDGWEDRAVHHDSDEKRLASLKMGANIIRYVFTAI